MHLFSTGASNTAGTQALSFSALCTAANFRQCKRACVEWTVGLADIENKDFAMTNFTKHRLAFLFSMEYYTTI